MTVAVAQMQYLSLTMQKSTLEYQIMNLMNKKTCLQTDANRYQEDKIKKYEAHGMDTSTIDWDNDATMRQINAQEKLLETTQKKLEMQQNAVATELDSVKKLAETNIKNDFKVNFGG